MALTVPLRREMKKNPRVIGVKNSSMAVMDIQQWRETGGEAFVVFNGPDEQFLSGLAAGAHGGIGGTYGVMPELFLKIYALYQEGHMETARQIQNEVTSIIVAMCAARGNLYAVMKGILRLNGQEIGSVRKPLPELAAQDNEIVTACSIRIQDAIKKYC